MPLMQLARERTGVQVYEKLPPLVTPPCSEQFPAHVDPIPIGITN